MIDAMLAALERLLRWWLRNYVPPPQTDWDRDIDRSRLDAIGSMLDDGQNWRALVASWRYIRRPGA